MMCKSIKYICKDTFQPLLICLTDNKSWLGFNFLCLVTNVTRVIVFAQTELPGEQKSEWIQNEFKRNHNVLLGLL